MLDFWFSQCDPCQESFPLMNKVYQRYKDNDRVKFIRGQRGRHDSERSGRAQSG